MKAATTRREGRREPCVLLPGAVRCRHARRSPPCPASGRCSPSFVWRSRRPLPKPDRESGADTLPSSWTARSRRPAAGRGGRAFYVLTWRVKEDDRPLRVESCLVLKDLGEDDGHGRWCLALLFRHPAAEDAAWRVPVNFPPPVPKGQPVAAAPESSTLEDRPGNAGVCKFLKQVRWQVTREEDWRLLGGAVRPRTWRADVGEKPPAFSDLGGRSALTPTCSATGLHSLPARPAPYTVSGKPRKPVGRTRVSGGSVSGSRSATVCAQRIGQPLDPVDAMPGTARRRLPFLFAVDGDDATASRP